MLHEVRAGVRLFGYVATSFDSEERGFFRRGMSTFLGIAPKQITINHVEDVNTRSTRRLLQAPAVDVYYVVSTTTPQVASAVVDETNHLKGTVNFLLKKAEVCQDNLKNAEEAASNCESKMKTAVRTTSDADAKQNSDTREEDEMLRRENARTCCGSAHA